LEHVLSGVKLQVTDGIKHSLDLSGDDGQHFDENSVELIEAAPRASLGKTHENLTHGLIIHLIGAIEHNDLEAEGTTQILGGLSLTGTGGASWGTTHGQVKSLGKSNVASIGQRSNDKTTAVTDVLVVVPGLPVTNTGLTNLLWLFGLALHVESKLILPIE